MTLRKFLISTVAVFGVIYAFDLLWHFVLLQDTYRTTANLWRSEQEMMDMFLLCVLAHLFISLITVSLFKNFIFNNKRDIKLKTALVAGLTLGELIGIIEMTSYLYMPIPFTLAFGWFANRVMQGIGIGYVLYFLNKPAPQKAKRPNRSGARKTGVKTGAKTRKTSSNPAARRTSAKSSTRRKKPVASA